MTTNKPLDDDAEFNAAFDEAAKRMDDKQEPETLQDDESEPKELDTIESDAEQGEPISDVEKLKRERDYWEHRYNSDVGRINAYQRQNQDYQRQIQELSEKVASSSNAREQNQNHEQARESLAQELYDSSWEELNEDFPEIAKAVDKRLSSQIDQAIAARFQQVEQTIAPIQQRLQQETLNREYAALEAAHPDWRDVSQSNDFGQWLETQPAQVQSLINSTSAADAAWLIDNFKRNTSTAPSLQQQRQQRLAASVGISSRRESRQPEATDDFDSAFDSAVRKLDRRRI